MARSSVPDPVGTAAAAHADRTVLATDDDRHLTGGELAGLVGARAGALRAAGVAPGERVAVARDDRLAACVDLLAVIRAGGVAAPVNPGSDVVNRLERGGLTTLLTDIDALGGLVGTSVTLLTDPPAGEPVGPEAIPADRAVSLVFTSGSTGEPTPVVHTAGNHAAASEAAVERLDLSPFDRWYDPLGLHHMGGFAPLTRCLPVGVPVVVSDEPGPTDLLARIDATGATVASVVPTMVHRALETEATVPAQLRCLLVGGAPLREALYRRARARELPVWASYGLTETMGQVATARPAERDAHPDTVGRPLAGVEVRIVGEDGRQRPPGEPGTIHVSGPTVSPQRATDRGAPAPGLLTGDVGHLDEAGRLWVHGRRDGAIQTGGEVVFPHRVEAVLAMHPTVDDAAVFGVDDPRWGERVVAVVAGEAPEADALGAWCRDHLPAHAVPKTFAVVDGVPRTVSGTVDVAALRERLAER